jgi:hypothetical protein
VAELTDWYVHHMGTGSSMQNKYNEAAKWKLFIKQMNMKKVKSAVWYSNNQDT